MRRISPCLIVLVVTFCEAPSLAKEPIVGRLWEITHPSPPPEPIMWRMLPSSALEKLQAELGGPRKSSEVRITGITSAIAPTQWIIDETNGDQFITGGWQEFVAKVLTSGTIYSGFSDPLPPGQWNNTSLSEDPQIRVATALEVNLLEYTNAGGVVLSWRLHGFQEAPVPEPGAILYLVACGLCWPHRLIRQFRA